MRHTGSISESRESIHLHSHRAIKPLILIPVMTRWYR